ncbi:carbonic anhydrase [Mycena epipterygia]|nr:carbonic anhydrase [Mycena epipterygia]
MSTADFVEANEKYAASFDKPDRSVFKNVIIGEYARCCSIRFELAEAKHSNLPGFARLKTGEAITIRNAGGSAKDALRSIMVAQHFVGVRGEIAVFHHKDCGLTKMTTEQMRELVKKANPGRDDVAATVDGMDFHHITNLEDSVRADVDFLAVENPLVVKGTKISGWIYDVDTGKISKVVEAVAQS